MPGTGNKIKNGKEREREREREMFVVVEVLFGGGRLKAIAVHPVCKLHPLWTVLPLLPFTAGSAVAATAAITVSVAAGGCS